jgi:hypothetical protein
MAKGVSLTDAQLHEAVRIYQQCGGNATLAAKRLGLTAQGVNKRLQAAERKGLVTAEQKASWRPDQPATISVEGQTLSVSGNSAEVTKTTHERVRTLNDLIRVCEIDTDEWDVERYVCNKWEMGAKIGPQDVATITVTPLYQVKAWLRRKVVVIAARDELAALLADAKRRITPRPMVKRGKRGSSHGRRKPAGRITTPRPRLWCLKKP